MLVADKTACLLLEGTEEQRNTLSEETVVQDEIDMERMLARLLPLLVSSCLRLDTVGRVVPWA